MNRVYFRVDDYPGTKPEEFWRHNLENFKKFNDVMKVHTTRYTLGVIPKHTQDSDIEWIGKQPNINVALHGVNHDERYQNEFRDWQTETDIYNSISSAKSSLERFCETIQVYIPPHNVIDNKTCNVLKKSGINHITSGPESDDNVLLYAQSIGLTVASSYKPFEYGRTDELMSLGSIEAIHKTLFERDVFITLHWTWEHNIGLDNLELYLRNLL